MSRIRTAVAARMSGKKRMSIKGWFILAVICAAVLLAALAILLYFSPLNFDKISFFSLGLELAVGGFTIWALWWAASEFAELSVRPSLRLLPGKVETQPWWTSVGTQNLDHSLITVPPFSIDGWTRTREMGGQSHRIPWTACGLFLDNESSRAGRYVQVVARVLSKPEPSACFFLHYISQEAKLKRVDGEKEASTGHWTLSLQFPAGLVVYQSPVSVGNLILRWSNKTRDEDLPGEIILQYEAHTLDGSSRGCLELHIAKWKKTA